MRSSFAIKPLVTAIAAFSVASVAQAAGLDRSGQDTTAFFQDGTYAEAVYTYIDADVTGRDAAGNKVKDIAKDYDFFRYGVKTDIDNKFSIGVLYDEPWGAAADYHGNNDFVGSPSRVADSLISSRLGNGAPEADNIGVNNVEQFKGFINQTADKLAEGRQQLATLQGFEQQLDAAIASGAPMSAIDQQVAQTAAQLGRPEINSFAAFQQLVNGTEQSLADGEANYQRLKGLEGVLDTALTNTEATEVEVRSESLTGLLGMKFGQNNNYQIYGGPVAQRLKAKVKLRGNAYETATGYDLNVNPDIDYGWIAGLQYSKPEIALKASLTYRSEIDHEVTASEYLPLAALRGVPPNQANKMEITTPESVNFDFQTGINPTTLATAKVRWVPWGDFKITPPLYNAASQFDYGPKGLNLVDYDDDQWVVELGLAKRLQPNLAISGTIGWDSGSGDPTTSLGPIEGYYSVGAGAKYNLDENWAISAGGKYLWFGDAKGQIPNGNIVSDFKDNDGFILGVKLSYQDK